MDAARTQEHSPIAGENGEVGRYVATPTGGARDGRKSQARNRCGHRIGPGRVGLGRDDDLLAAVRREQRRHGPDRYNECTEQSDFRFRWVIPPDSVAGRVRWCMG